MGRLRQIGTGELGLAFVPTVFGVVLCR
jgi:hypothetical protein